MSLTYSISTFKDCFASLSVIRHGRKRKGVLKRGKGRTRRRYKRAGVRERGGESRKSIDKGVRCEKRKKNAERKKNKVSEGKEGM